MNSTPERPLMEYAVLSAMDPRHLDAEINEHAAQGWRLHSFDTTWCTWKGGGDSLVHTAVMEREAKVATDDD